VACRNHFFLHLFSPSFLLFQQLSPPFLRPRRFFFPSAKETDLRTQPLGRHYRLVGISPFFPPDLLQFPFCAQIFYHLLLQRLKFPFSPERASLIRFSFCAGAFWERSFFRFFFPALFPLSSFPKPPRSIPVPRSSSPQVWRLPYLDSFCPCFFSLSFPLDFRLSRVPEGEALGLQASPFLLTLPLGVTFFPAWCLTGHGLLHPPSRNTHAILSLFFSRFFFLEI